MTCRVPNCIAESGTDDDICPWHRSLPDEALAELLRVQIGLVAPLQPVTTRIEYAREEDR